MTYPTFASGDVLLASDMNAVGLWLIKTQTIGSAVSTVTVTGAFSSTYDNYRVVVNVDSVAAGGPYSTIALGSTTTGYYWGGFQANYSTAAVTGLSSNNQASWNRLGPLNTTGGSFSFDLLNPNRAYRTVIQSNYTDFATAGGAGAGSGFLNDTTAYTSFILGLTSSTMTGGNIRVYGYRN
jgi:hypothetical protein